MQVKYNDGFEAEDNASQGSVNSQVPLDRHRSAQRYNQSSGLYDPSSGTATPVSGSSSRYVIDLGHHPGESDVGYENVAFTRGSGSMEGSVHFAGNVLYYRCSCSRCRRHYSISRLS